MWWIGQLCSVIQVTIFPILYSMRWNSQAYNKNSNYPYTNIRQTAFHAEQLSKNEQEIEHWNLIYSDCDHLENSVFKRQFQILIIYTLLWI